MPDNLNPQSVGNTIASLPNDAIHEISDYMAHILRRYLHERDENIIEDIVQDTWLFLLSDSKQPADYTALKKIAGTIARRKLLHQRRDDKAAYRKRTIPITDSFPDYRGID